MARRKVQGNPNFGSVQYVCTACDAQSREKGYQVTNVPKGETNPKCSYCGKTGKMEVELKHHRTMRVGSLRIQKIAAEIDTLDKLFAHGNYEWKPGEAERMFKILSDYLEAKRKRFTQPISSIRSIDLL